MEKTTIKNFENKNKSTELLAKYGQSDYLQAVGNLYNKCYKDIVKILDGLGADWSKRQYVPFTDKDGIEFDGLDQPYATIDTRDYLMDCPVLGASLEKGEKDGVGDNIILIVDIEGEIEYIGLYGCNYYQSVAFEVHSYLCDRMDIEGNVPDLEVFED